MLPPRWVCEELYRIDNRYRLAWCGRPPNGEELNPGDFAIVELYHRRDFGSYDEPRTFREAWLVTIDAQNWDGWSEVPMKRSNRGPIFNRRGGSTPDWDEDNYVPVFVAPLDEHHGLSVEDIYSGAFLQTIRRWRTSIVERHREKVRQERAVMRAASDDQAEAATDFWKHEASKHTSTSKPIARKHWQPEYEHWLKTRGNVDHIARMLPDSTAGL